VNNSKVIIRKQSCMSMHLDFLKFATVVLRIIWQEYGALHFLEMHGLVKDEIVFARGNIHGRDGGTHMHKPKVWQGTEHVIEEMVKMSLLGTKAKMIGGTALKKTTRSSSFAKALPMKNLLEGFTVALTDIDKSSNSQIPVRCK
jgi:hypothetical protein